MKSAVGCTFLVIMSFYTYSQSVDNEVKLSDLAVPTSPAFIITDISPSTFQTPTTPKSFILGLVQSYEESSDGFPQNYSAEFAPYWWLNPAKRNVYSFLGIEKPRPNTADSVAKANPFSGLKFTTVSLAFLKKDLIADTVDNAQKMFSLGVRTTILKFHNKKYASAINAKVKEWHNLTQAEMAIVQGKLTRASDAERAELLQEFANFKPKTTTAKLKEISELIAQKPLFSWDIAGAFATYGVGDSTWRAGRTGVWTTLSTYLPLGKEKEIQKKYFNLNLVVRYLRDNYHGNEEGVLSRANNLDVGGKIALEFDKLSIGYEALFRYVDGKGSPQNRNVGIINYRIADNIYLNGAYGENFDLPGKLVALFGITWGIGTETVKLPQ